MHKTTIYWTSNANVSPIGNA
uniref:Uncharacterized protein n=1 Tax=Arundo donax TaxID=35708 RepID=A0A0A8YSC3_ARUDO